MKLFKFLCLVYLILPMVTKSEEKSKRTIASFFVGCKDASCCEANLANCKAELTDSSEICQRGFEACSNFVPSNYS